MRFNKSYIILIAFFSIFETSSTANKIFFQHQELSIVLTASVRSEPETLCRCYTNPLYVSWPVIKSDSQITFCINSYAEQIQQTSKDEKFFRL